ncbi:NTF2 fold immunity protein [Sediminitomix flava]|uniref:NTF2 fold immunity protein of polymorphic toxin system component n=1 Tax=Sediminitomix flava TaxID=379075 RepID=A0A315YWF0_SEDFL|nr:NTF2 fold immunity protein [Sediminitomix flava]PWJ33122.1 NTF2 fold immunity protein of polymorphic toxin system component [Sediminitomix flava]
MLNRILFITFFFFISFDTIAQDLDRYRMTESQASVYLQNALDDKKQHNFIGLESILDTEEIAISFAEMILMKVYGVNQIQDQRPYDAFQLDGYWIIKGTIPKQKRGGTFLIIICDKTCEIVRLTHRK